jgi:hypothetical protein
MKILHVASMIWLATLMFINGAYAVSGAITNYHKEHYWWVLLYVMVSIGSSLLCVFYIKQAVIKKEE